MYILVVVENHDNVTCSRARVYVTGNRVYVIEPTRLDMQMTGEIRSAEK